MTPVYTAVAHTNKGGRQGGRAETDDGRVGVDLAFPKEMGGDGNGTNPEQLVALGYSACFASAVGAVAKSSGQDIEGLDVTCRATIGREGEGFALSFEIKATLPKLSQADADELIAKAHEMCPYSRAFRHTAPAIATAKGGA